MLVSSAYNDDTASNAGQAWLIYGPLSGTYDLGSSSGYDVSFLGDEAGDLFGYAATMGSDLDDDRFDDVVIGAPMGDQSGYSDRRTVYVFHGG